jgi:nucleotide-binding universal stress UspA family protein
MIHFKCSKVLIPVDFSDTSMLAIKHGAFLAQNAKAEVYLLHVVNAHYMAQNMFLPNVSLDMNAVESKASQRLNELAKDIKTNNGMDAQIVIKTGNPSNEISKIAKELGIDLIVMGTHGYSPLEELVIGSTALKVITKSQCQVMAMSSAATKSGYSKIVMPIDTTVNSKQKAHYTLELAKKFNATVHAIVLLDSGEEQERPKMELILKQIKELATEKGTSYQSEILSGVKNRATSTVNYIDKIGGDLVVIMTDQDAELSGFFLGPYSQQVIHLSKVPVIAVKPLDLFIDDVDYLPNTSGS